jgi:hypothetical protein
MMTIQNPFFENPYHNLVLVWEYCGWDELPKFVGALITLQVHHHMEWYCQDNGKEVGGLHLLEIFVDAHSA